MTWGFRADTCDSYARHLPGTLIRASLTSVWLPLPSCKFTLSRYFQISIVGEEKFRRESKGCVPKGKKTHSWVGACALHEGSLRVFLAEWCMLSDEGHLRNVSALLTCDSARCCKTCWLLAVVLWTSKGKIHRGMAALVVISKSENKAVPDCNASL